MRQPPAGPGGVRLHWLEGDLRLSASSACQGAAGEPVPETADHPVAAQYVEHQGGSERSDTQDLGALEGYAHGWRRRISWLDMACSLQPPFEH